MATWRWTKGEDKEEEKNYMNNKSEEANKFDFNNNNEEENKEHMVHRSFSGMGLVGELKTDTLR